MSGPWEDYAPAATKERGPWDDFSAEAQRGTIAKLTDPFRQGLSSALSGYQSTAHETGNDGVVSSALGAGAKMVAPTEGTYTPAHVTLNPATWGDIPKAVAEAVPGMAPDIAAGAAGAAMGGAVGGPFAPITAAAGGVLGATGSYLLRNYGNDARGAAVARGGDNNTELTNADKARALLMGGVGGVASRVGLSALGSPVKAGAGSMASQLAPQVVKGVGIDAGTGVAQEAAHQALIDQQLDASKLGGALVTGGATGAALRGVSAVKDVNAASKFKTLDNEHANPVANDLLSVESPHKPGGGADSFHRVQKVSDLYGNKVDATLSSAPIKERLAALKEHDPLDPTQEAITNVKTDLEAGRKPSQDDLELIHNRLGDVETNGPGLSDLFKRQDTINQLKSKGNWDEGAQTFTGGVSSNPFVQNVINPLGKLGKYADTAALTYAALGHTLPGMHVMHAMTDPASAVALPLAQTGLYGAARGFDALTGNRNPMKQFTDRFSGGDSAGPSVGTPGSPNGPQSGAEIAQAVQAARTAALNEKVSAKQERGDADLQNRQLDKQAATQQSASQSLDRQRSAAFVKQQVALENAAKALEKQKSAAMGKQAEEEFNGPKEDATLRIKVAKYRQDQAAKREATALQEQKAQAKADAAQAKLEAKRKPAADGGSSASPSEVASAAQEAKTTAKAASAAARTAQRARKAQSDVPETTPIVTDHGTRNQIIDDIRVSKRAIANGINKRAGTRSQALEDMLTVPLSKDGHHYMVDRAKGILEHSFDNSDSHAARDHIETVLDGLSRSDAKKMRDHLREAGYYKSWRD